MLLNHAGAAFPELLGGACIAALDAFEMPVGLNVYASGPGLAASAPPHTDRQEVVVAQCAGKKRWRVFRPPSVSDQPERDPYARGKGSDVLDEDSLICLLDAVLEERDVRSPRG